MSGPSHSSLSLCFAHWLCIRTSLCSPMPSTLYGSEHTHTPSDSFFAYFKIPGVIIWARTENVSEGMPRQTPDHSFMGHFHSTNLLLNPDALKKNQTAIIEKIIWFRYNTKLLLFRCSCSSVPYFSKNKTQVFFYCTNSWYTVVLKQEFNCIGNVKTIRLKVKELQCTMRSSKKLAALITDHPSRKDYTVYKQFIL